MFLLQIGLTVVGLIAFVMILVDAFSDEVWKGVVALLCGLYALYYAIFELEHEHKWLITAGYVVGGAATYSLRLV